MTRPVNMTRPMKLSRRRLLQQSAFAASSLFAAPALISAQSPNEKLNLAFIGVGGRGGANLKTIAGSGTDRVVAICDVNARNLGKAAEQFPNARTYADFRRL